MEGVGVVVGGGDSDAVVEGGAVVVESFVVSFVVSFVDSTIVSVVFSAVPLLFDATPVVSVIPMD